MNESQQRWARRFKWISLAEGLSFLLLLGIAMPLKYVFDWPLAVKYVGWAHGLLFVVYIYAVFPTSRSLKWEFGRIIFALIASLLPFGPFIFDRNLNKSQQTKF
jgi:integral membrane protein